MTCPKRRLALNAFASPLVGAQAPAERSDADSGEAAAPCVLRSRPTSRRSRVRGQSYGLRAGWLSLFGCVPRVNGYANERRQPAQWPIEMSIALRGGGVRSGCKPDEGGGSWCLRGKDFCPLAQTVRATYLM